MGYQIKRKRYVTKTLDLLDDEGKVEKTLTVDIAVDDFRNRYPYVMAEISKAQRMLDAKGDKNPEAIVAAEVAVKALFTLVFGAIQTKDFLQYYATADGYRYSEAFESIIPFITDEIIPEVNKAVEQENNRIQGIMK